MNLKLIKQKILSIINNFKTDMHKNIYTPTYRVIEILQDSDNDYIVRIQIINKNITFKIKPEEILANDKMVNMFSPCDIRTLTYLGYLGINSPKYKILAKHLSENDNKLIFSLKTKDNKLVTKTANEIIKEKNILDNLNAEDSHIIGYTLAYENIKAEELEKEYAVNQLKKTS